MGKITQKRIAEGKQRIAEAMAARDAVPESKRVLVTNPKFYGSIGMTGEELEEDDKDDSASKGSVGR